MNTLASIAGIVATGWLANFVFTTLSFPVLGFALVVVTALMFPLTWVAIMHDREILGK